MHPRLIASCAFVGLGALALAAQLAACGNCGESAPRPATHPTQAVAKPPTPPPPTRFKTAGGVVLEDTPDDVGQAATALARERERGVKELIAAGPRAKDAVLHLLGSRNVSELRGAIACVRAEGDPIGLRADALDALLPLMTHDAPDVRDDARAAIDQIADVGRIIETLGSSVAAARLGAVRTLAEWDGTAVQAALAARLDDADLSFAREAMLAATAAGKAPSPVITAAAQKLLTVGGERAAIGLQALRRMGVAMDAKALAAVFASTDPQLLAEAIRTAGETLAPEQRDQFIADTHVEVRRALAEVTTRPPELAILTHDADATVRAAAIGGLARAGAAVDRLATLTPFLKDPDAMIQRAAIAAIAAGARPEPAVRTILEWSKGDPNAPAFAIAALGRIDDRAAVDALIGFVPEDVFGLYAQSVLGAMSGESHGADVAAWNAWRDRKYPDSAPK